MITRKKLKNKWEEYKIYMISARIELAPSGQKSGIATILLEVY